MRTLEVGPPFGVRLPGGRLGRRLPSLLTVIVGTPLRHSIALPVIA
ncbi:MAG TPA: hypothetical protein VGB74_19410 [Actinoplanes sp.]